MMLVNSLLLENSAAAIRKRKRGPMTIREEGIAVSAAQCETAARLLKEAEPSIITKASGAVGNIPLGVPQERPGFIEKLAQDEPEVLVFQVGILPSDTYRIDREGKIL